MIFFFPFLMGFFFLFFSIQFKTTKLGLRENQQVCVSSTFSFENQQVRRRLFSICWWDSSPTLRLYLYKLYNYNCLLVITNSNHLHMSWLTPIIGGTDERASQSPFGTLEPLDMMLDPTLDRNSGDATIPLYTLSNPPTPIRIVSSKIFVTPLISVIEKWRQRSDGSDRTMSHLDVPSPELLTITCRCHKTRKHRRVSATEQVKPPTTLTSRMIQV